ncbi:glycosyltransferase [Clostridium sp. ZS1]|uniref:glycosyltransferase n=1 Tax=Clostridium sp. ZS1 TaxID=2949989 RepID=UPI00207A5B33|nr:glycosyltransferase [Clostridium sp. ZS1]
MIKNQSIARQMLEIIDTLIEEAESLHKTAKEHDFITFENIYTDMHDLINSIYNIIANIKNEENLIISTDIACESIQDSLNRIIMFSKTRSQKLLDKIEFELIPFLQDVYLQLYFWGCVYPDKEKMKYYYNNEMKKLSSNKYINESEDKGKYKYELSIVVHGYNKLEYTKLCIESLLRFLPNDINYELILLNHGSTDGTKEYFESIAPTKQVDIMKNGSFVSVIHRIIEGKYYLSISNDVLVTKNAISNMIKCMESDENIAWIVPSTPNVSNYQAINSNYTDMDEMYKFASDNNVSNIYRWEQRPRLCNPIDLCRSKSFLSTNGICLAGYFHSTTFFSFPDDKLSLLLRRNDYKMILAKDVYCYHFGSITVNDDIAKYKDKNGNIGGQAFLNEGRQEFYNAFGIDPWGTGCCFNEELFKYLPCNDTKHVDVLGINCGIGSNPLKVKESIKEIAHNLDVTIYNITDEENYIEDLKGISNVAEYINSCEDIDRIFTGKKFKYIIFESKIETYKDPLLIISELKKHLVEDGIIGIKTLDKNLQINIKSNFLNSIQSDEWIILK